MKRNPGLLVLIPILTAFFFAGCVANPPTPDSPIAQSSPSPSVPEKPVVGTNSSAHSQLTLPVLDALFANQEFVAQLKSKLQITDDQIEALKKVAAEEVDRLRAMNAEQSEAKSSEARSRATEKIASIIGNDRTTQLAGLTDEFWARGEGTNDTTSKNEDSSLPKVPNSVPTDTRIVVNIPAYRMDLFKDGSLVKSYKIGIGYPEFPLPEGLRKAQTIIFNPTWTPPDSPWVAKMKNVTPGEKVEAGSKSNPLGPVKVPIGMPSLIHGGKSPAKLGTFASHGCVGLTNAQVKDFARMLGELSQTEVTENSISTYLKDPTQTRVVKLNQTIPVELRYETIVLEDGTLHIYKDVYEHNTNTEANLRAVLEANGSSLEDLSEEERAQALTALNLMSAHSAASVPASPSSDKNLRVSDKERSNKKLSRNQKEIVIELMALARRGYPAPVNFDVGTGKSVSRIAAK
jgi:lipoprotein-anchoring transpeptidase ErfK/SrfK